MSDRYTKLVLTLIALTLLWNATPQALTGAKAQSGRPCGDIASNPCFVAFSGLDRSGTFEFCDLNRPCMGVLVLSK